LVEFRVKNFEVGSRGTVYSSYDKRFLFGNGQFNEGAFVNRVLTGKLGAVYFVEGDIMLYIDGDTASYPCLSSVMDRMVVWDGGYWSKIIVKPGFSQYQDLGLRSEC
jgi:hypothetical protein